MSVTIKDIARAAGVSHATVSRALRDNPLIAAETGARIRRLAAEMGYVPNTVARGLKTSRSGALGVIVRRFSDPFFGEVLNGIEDVLAAQGYSLVLAAVDRNPAREKAIIRTMAERRVDGVIICSTHIDEEHVQHLAGFGVPCVLINNQAPADMTQAVYHDDRHGAAAVAEHLLALGHRRLAYIGNARAGRTTRDRRDGVVAALRARGVALRPELFVDGHDGTIEAGAEAVRQLLALAPPPTALICFNDLMAVGALRAARDAGLTVPGDCSVTGFDNIDLSAYVTPALTTLDQPRYGLGEAAAQMMLRLLADGGGEDSAEPTRLTLQGRLLVRDSTAPPPPGSGTAPDRP